MVHRTIEQELNLYGHSFFQTVGDSMEPYLHNRKSTVVIQQVRDTLQRYDVVLYRRPTGEYVLHRIIKIVKNLYYIRGDNRISTEIIPSEWIIGVMIGFYEDEQNNYISCEDRKYRRYLKLLPLRRKKLFFQYWIRRLREKILKEIGIVVMLIKRYK